MERIAVIPKTYPVNVDLNPYEILCCLEGEPHPVLLESGVDAGGLGRYSIISADPHLCFQSHGEGYSLKRRGESEHCMGEPFQGLEALLKRYESSHRGPLPFYGGAIGAFSYDLKDRLERLPDTADRDIPFPEIWLGFYHWALIVDHQLGRLSMVISEWEPEPEHCYERVMDLLRKKGPEAAMRKLPPRIVPPVFETNMTKDSYLNAIERVRDYICRGDIYQANYTQRFHCNIEGGAQTLYGKMRQVNPAPFAAYLDIGEFQVVSASPERFIQVKDRIIETRPIKGTRPRGKTPEEDAANSRELMASEKDQAELLMIVDLERNDLSRLAKTGTVEVTELFKLETYATVFHLVATVKAHLKDGVSTVDCLRATFPGGSITGAPKIRAMEIIDELEPTARNIYTGSIGYIGYNGDLDLNIVIRTVLCQGENAWFQVGGGIVWDSDPQMEYEECLHKAKGQIAALSM